MSLRGSCRGLPVGNDMISNSPVDLRRHHSLIQQIELAPIGPEPHNPPGPGNRQPRYLHELRDCRPIQVG